MLDEEELSSQSQPNQMGECNDIFVSNDQCDMFAHVEKELEEGLFPLRPGEAFVPACSGLRAFWRPDAGSKSVERAMDLWPIHAK